MKKDTVNPWVKAAIVLSENPTAQVYCPECEKAYLQTQDKRGGKDLSVIERKISCPSCGACNYLRLVRPLGLSDPSTKLDSS
ncbi:MAG: hypothetical protein LBE24_08170 [Methylobacillus sp.]|jgi:coenzyme F420-reducing hydrogenase gamma subunit|nr:hypothetical protein [Methylobacillus sp.]